MSTSRNFKTSHGTELPLLNLRGKEYLEVKYRLVWFREEHPDWTIQTEFISITDKSALAKATITDALGRIVSTSHKFENEREFPDFLEKAETGAIGRALALIGYGTQFCADELDEGSRIVDAPAHAPRVISASSTLAGAASVAAAVPPPTAEAAHAPGGDEGLEPAMPGLTRRSIVDPGDFQVPFGRKYKGKKVKEIPRRDIESYLTWLEGEAEKKGTPLSYEARLLKTAVELFYEKSGEQDLQASG